MHEVDQEVKSYLESRFGAVRQTEKGFRFNVEQLNRADSAYINDVPCTNEVLTKRSGTGLVIIIE